MNEELIQRLVDQCVVKRERYGTTVDVLQSRKFAELILIEVTDILSTYRGKMVFEDGAEYNYEHPIIAIRKHFGVESA